MPASRNPFFVRTAEQSGSDEQFLSLFSLAVLDLLPEDGSWNRLLRIELPPGAGKSTLLRLFTPTVLTTIATRRHHSDFQPLAAKLSDIGAIDTNGVQLLGVLVNCKDDFNRLADLEIGDKGKLSLFWALLHSRLALLTIRATLQLNQLVYPVDVHSVRLEPRPDGVIRRPDARIISGADLYERSRKTEQNIVDSLNRFVPEAHKVGEDSTVGDFFQLLNTHRISVIGGRTTKHILFMFDDAHMLDDSQRTPLYAELLRHDQSAFASWVATRLNALSPPDVIMEVVHPNRESFTPLSFDNWSSQRMESWLLEVSDRRAQRAQRDVSSFEACLSHAIETEFNLTDLEKIAKSERELVHQLAEPYGVLYSLWLDYWESRMMGLPPLEQANGWAQLHIIMTRRIQKLQLEFAFDPLPISLIEKIKPGKLEMASMFVSERNGLPYYFGTKKVAQLASSNVDQFLSLSAALFDLFLDGGYRGRRRPLELPPSAQHQPHSSAVQKLPRRSRYKPALRLRCIQLGDRYRRDLQRTVMATECSLHSGGDRSLHPGLRAGCSHRNFQRHPYARTAPSQCLGIRIGAQRTLPSPNRRQAGWRQSGLLLEPFGLPRIGSSPWVWRIPSAHGPMP